MIKREPPLMLLITSGFMCMLQMLESGGEVYFPAE